MSVDSSNNVAGYGGALAGGTIGALYGAKTAPSVLGQLDVDKILTNDIQTDIAHDKILKHLGEAQKDFFVKSRGSWFDIEHCIPNDVNMMFNSVGAESEVTVGQLKQAIADGKIVSCKANGIEQIENYKKAFEGLAEETKLTKDSLGKLLRENHSIYNGAKADILNILEHAPKLKGRYAAIYGAVGALTAGFLGMLVGNSANKQKSEASTDKIYA